MDRLEELVRDTLTEHAAAAPTALTDRAHRPGSRRPRWALWAPIAAAAAVIAIVAGLALAQSHLKDAQPAGPGPQQSIPPAPPVPAGYKLVSYHGIQFAVPASMGVMHATCGELLPNTVLTQNPGMVSGCTPGGNPKPKAGATYVEVEPPGWYDERAAQQLAATATTAAGGSARIGYGARPDYPGVTGVLILSAPANQLTVTAPTRAEVTTILSSVRRTPTDAVGCPQHAPTVSGNEPADSPAPMDAIAISLCGYAGFSTDHNSDFWLAGSAAMPGDRVKSLLAQLDALPDAGSLAGTGPLHDYVRIGYPNGRVRWLSINLRHSGPDLVVTDGHHFGLAREGGTSVAGNAVNELLYPGTAWPESAVPQPSSTGSGQDSPRPPTTADTSATPTVPAGHKLVSYHGIEFAVLASMQVGHLSNCGLRPNGVRTDDPGMFATCGLGGDAKPRAGAIYVQAYAAGDPDAAPAAHLATEETTEAGRPARIGFGTLNDVPGITGVLILSDPAVQLTITAPTRADVADILGSVRLAPVDAVGCPQHEPTPFANAAASSVAPAGATAMSLCGYWGFSADHRSDFWLTGSAEAPSDRIESLLSQLDALPDGAPRAARPLHEYVRLSYPGGQVRWLAMSVAGNSSDLGFTDGQHTKLAHENTAIWKLLYPGTAWPESVFSSH